ncbi:MAG: hypothetical protein ACYTGW_10230 [Planctomycetota bacterium]|jgi:tetratricopeptide (TPR) repeat protein
MIRRKSIVAWALFAGLASWTADLAAQDQPVPPPRPPKKVDTARAGADRVEAHVKKILALAMELRESGFEEEAQALMQQARRLADKNRRKATRRKGRGDKARRHREREPEAEVAHEHEFEGEEAAKDRMHDLPADRKHDLRADRKHDLKVDRKHDLGVDRKHDLGVDSEHAHKAQAALERAQKNFAVARDYLKAGETDKARKHFAAVDRYLKAAEAGRRALEHRHVDGVPRAVPKPRVPRVPPEPRAPREPGARRRNQEAETQRLQRRIQEAIRRARRTSREPAPDPVRVPPSGKAGTVPEPERTPLPEAVRRKHREADLDGRVDHLAEQVRELRQAIRELKRAVDNSGGHVRRSPQSK